MSTLAPAATETAKNQWLEGFRLLALLLLVAYHVSLINWGSAGPGTAWLLQLTRMGWIGSDLFLCLAGFLMVQSFGRRGAGIKAYGGFMRDRAWRILPAYFVFLAIYLHTGNWFNDFMGLGWKLSEGFEPWLWLFGANLPMAAHRESGVALEGLFALSAGMQLFAVLGLATALIRRRAWLAGLLLSLEILAVALRLLNPDPGPWSNYFFTATRMDGFLLGMLLGLGLEQPRLGAWLRRRRLALALGATLLFLAVLALTKGFSLWDSALTVWLPYPFIALFWAGLILLAHDRPKLPRPLAWAGRLGALSYPSYLLKLPVCYAVFRSAQMLGLEPGLPGLVLLFAASAVAVFAGGSLLRGLIELPVQLFRQALKARYR